MAPRSIGLHDELQAYVAGHSSPPDPVRVDLIERTEALGPAAGMQISPEQGELLTILTRLVRPRLAIEIGTFTGYSALSIASGLGPDGRLICCDVSDEWTTIAREHWEAAGVDDRIELRLGPASETLAELPDGLEVDLAFVDADKEGYVDYYEELVPRLSQGGLICVDNTLRGGAVLDDDDTSSATEAIRRFNDHVHADPRTRQVVVPIGDGLTVIVRAESA